MTNRELGDRIGVSHSMASRIRAGKRLPGVEVLTKLADVLLVPLDHLAGAHTQGAPAFGREVRRLIECLPHAEGDNG